MENTRLLISEYFLIGHIDFVLIVKNVIKNGKFYLAPIRAQREILGFTDQSFFVKIVFTKMLKFS